MKLSHSARNHVFFLHRVKMYWRGFALIMSIFLSATCPLEAAVGTAFTYQGLLKDNGILANGKYDLEFKLFDALTIGHQIGSSVLLDDLDIVNGLFTASLDFGAAAFVGEARWLEIGVRPWDSISTFTSLIPRQPLSASPYALYALSAPTGNALNASGGTPANSVYVNSSGYVGIGTTSPDRKLEVAGASALARITSSSLTGPRLELKSSSPDTASHTVGALDFLDRLETRQGGVAYQTSLLGDRLIFSAGGVDRMVIDQDGRVGIGTVFPNTPLQVEGGTEATLSGGGYLIVGARSGLNLVMDSNEIQARNDSSESTLNLNPHGGDVAIAGNITAGGNAIVNGRIGLGIASPQTPLHITSGNDIEPASGGMVVIGATSGSNVGLDNNEIMARNNGATSPLYLNNDGGDVVIGGALSIGYEIITASSGSDSAQANCPAGKLAIGGGCDCGIDLLRKSRPLNGGATWDCVCDSSGVAAYAICARIK